MSPLSTIFRLLLSVALLAPCASGRAFSVDAAGAPREEADVTTYGSAVPHVCRDVAGFCSVCGVASPSLAVPYVWSGEGALIASSHAVQSSASPIPPNGHYVNTVVGAAEVPMPGTMASSTHGAQVAGPFDRRH